MTADNSVFQYSNVNDMRVTQDLNSFGEIIAHAQCSVDENNIYIFRVYHIRIIATTKTKRANKKERLRITDNYASSVLLRKPRNGIVHTAHTNKRVCVGVLTTIKS